MRSPQSVNELENNIADVIHAAVKHRAWEETEHRCCVYLSNQSEMYAPRRDEVTESGDGSESLVLGSGPFILLYPFMEVKWAPLSSATESRIPVLPGNRTPGLRSVSTDCWEMHSSR